MTDDQNPTDPAPTADAEDAARTEARTESPAATEHPETAEPAATSAADEPQSVTEPSLHEVPPETGEDLPGEPAWDRVETPASATGSPDAESAAPPQFEPEEPSHASEDEPSTEPAKPKKPRAKKTKAAGETTAPTPAVEPAHPTDPHATASAAGGSLPAGEASAATAEPVPESKKKWYAIKVQSGREESIKAAIERKVAIENLEQYYGRIVIPVEEVIEKKQVKVTDKKTGEVSYQEKKVTKKKKKYHGYIFAELEFNDELLYLIRETSGVGDFVGIRPGAKGAAARPDPMPEHEVQAMLTGAKPAAGGKGRKQVVKLDFEKGDRVKLREGAFANQEGEVKLVTEAKDPTDSPKVTVVVTIWGRPVEVVLDAWQVEKV